MHINVVFNVFMQCMNCIVLIYIVLYSSIWQGRRRRSRRRGRRHEAGEATDGGGDDGGVGGLEGVAETFHQYKLYIENHHTILKDITYCFNQY